MMVKPSHGSFTRYQSSFGTGETLQAPMVGEARVHYLPSNPIHFGIKGGERDMPNKHDV